MADRFTDGIGGRLRQVIPDGGIRGFHREMEKRGVRGSSYAMIHRYLAGDDTPPLELLEAAADHLGVSAAWLICGEGSPTKLREGAQDLLEHLSLDAAYELAPLAHDKRAVIDAFHAAIRRLYEASEETEPDPEKVTRMAGLLVRMVRKPYWQLRHNLPGGPQQTDDYYMAALHALTLIMPMWRSVDSIDSIISQMEG